MKFVGYAAVYDVTSPRLNEKIMPGTFSESLRARRAKALYSHDKTQVLGRQSDGTLRVFDSDYGLAVEIDPPDSEIARDLVRGMERGFVRGMSIAMTDVESRLHTDGRGKRFRTIIKATLNEVSITSTPAYPQTRIGVVRVSPRVKPRSRSVVALARELQLAEAEGWFLMRGAA